ncbi:AMP-binding enzyme [Musa troglodytarum]|uniref:AMP-binding enzyme n=1 Tax=Musa troglodytarum TaxID=320322 RepID=A0A9E7F512_9LILI|nr:AMP-binding enzyme [Musa troglodytarum]
MDQLGANAANSGPHTPLSYPKRTAPIYGDCPSVVYNLVPDPPPLPPPSPPSASPAATCPIFLGDGARPQHSGHVRDAVLNTMNTCLDARTVSVLLHHSGSKLVFVDVPSLPLLDDRLRLFPDSLEPPRVILIDDRDEAPPAQHSTLTYERLIETGDPECQWVRPCLSGTQCS